MKSRPTSIDLFCGAGGMSLGFEQAGFDVLAAFDLEEFNIATHKKNFPNTAAYAVDLTKETGSSLRKLANLDGRKVDVVFGGPPCQGFSIGGRKNVNDVRNFLVYDFARLIRELNPEYFVMENVKGLLSGRSKPILDEFVRRIRDSQYDIVTPIRALNAADFGVPQRRWRTIILGYRKGSPAPIYPARRGLLDANGKALFPVVKDAISDLPKLEDFPNLFEQDVFEGSLRNTKNRYAGLMRGTIADPDDRSRKRPSAGHGLSGCFRTRHSDETIRRFGETIPGAAEAISRYIRLAFEAVSPTIRAGTGAEHGSHTAPRPIHPTLPRCISTREAARLHSLPDWFQFHGTRWHDFRQIGNSVPPLLARAIGRELIEALKSESGDNK